MPLQTVREPYHKCGEIFAFTALGRGQTPQGRGALLMGRLFLIEMRLSRDSILMAFYTINITNCLGNVWEAIS